MSINILRRFVRGEAGAIAVEWTVLTAAVVGLGIGSVVAVRTGVISLGGETSGAVSSGGSATPPIIGGGDTRSGSGGGGTVGAGGDTRDGGSRTDDGTTIIRMNGSYVPLTTDPNRYAMLLYEMTGLSAAELADTYSRYLNEALTVLQYGDSTAAAEYLDVAGAAYSTLVDSGYDIPRGDVSLADLYARLSASR